MLAGRKNKAQQKVAGLGFKVKGFCSAKAEQLHEEKVKAIAPANYRIIKFTIPRLATRHAANRSGEDATNVRIDDTAAAIETEGASDF